MTAKQGWMVLLLVVLHLERHLKNHGESNMLSHAAWRSRWLRFVISVVFLHLMDKERRLHRVDPVSYIGRFL